ncbi:MAG: CehA/McbA family metallohydrolase, partial [Actinocatenispora sp.]
APGVVSDGAPGVVSDGAPGVVSDGAPGVVSDSAPDPTSEIAAPDTPVGVASGPRVQRPRVLRRRVLLGAGIATGVASITLGPVGFVPSASGTTRSKTVTGHFDPGAPDYAYLPVEVPRGTNKIAVEYSYSRPTVPSGTRGNACDIGIFDERGARLGGEGFRGWSGGARTSFEISASAATPAYLPGPVGPGTWHVVLSPYTVAPQGLDYTVTVTLTFGEPGEPYRPRYPPERAAGRGLSWYRGDSHLHSVHSDGQRTPAQIAAGARAHGLDFITTTDHNTSSAHAAWAEYTGDDLLVITGQEVTTRNGHYLALGLPGGEWVDWRYRVADNQLARFVGQIHRAGGLFVPAHPYGTCPACNWKFGYELADAMEVWNGTWKPDDESSVALWDGFLVDSLRSNSRWLPAMGNSDAHSDANVIGLPQTVVRAPELSRDAVIAGIAAGRSWLAESSSVALTFTVSGDGRTAQIGDRLPVESGATVTARVEVSGVPDGRVRVITDRGELHAESLPAGGSGTITWRTTPQYSAYVRIEVRHDDADASPPYGTMAALTNPIFLG